MYYYHLSNTIFNTATVHNTYTHTLTVHLKRLLNGLLNLLLLLVLLPEVSLENGFLFLSGFRHSDLTLILTPWTLKKTEGGGRGGGEESVIITWYKGLCDRNVHGKCVLRFKKLVW